MFAYPKAMTHNTSLSESKEFRNKLSLTQPMET